MAVAAFMIHLISPFELYTRPMKVYCWTPVDTGGHRWTPVTAGMYRQPSFRAVDRPSPATSVIQL
jgi:hypothetical protein